MARLMPGARAPDLRFDTVAHGAYDLAADVPPGGTLVVFHRGGHCKWTRLALKELDDHVGDFALRGVRVVAVGCEDRNRAAALNERMQIIRMPLGHSLDPGTVARGWGLYLTRNSTEPDAPPLHWEPAQFWVRADGTIGTISVQSGPNLWPDILQTIRGIENTRDRFPERGTG